MAISLLAQNDAQGTGTGATPSITLTAGAGNRRLFVAYSEEDTSAPGTITMTFGGNALSQVVSVAPDSSARTVIFELLEANMPANGSQTLSITAGSSAPGWAYSYWLIDGAVQTTAVSNSNSVLNGGAAGTTISTTLTAADAGSFLCAGMYKNNSTGTVTMTAPASSTLTLDTAGADASERLAFGHKLGSLSVGSNTVTFTHDSQSRRCIAALLVAPAPTVRNISGGFTLGAVTVAGNVVATDRNVSGAITTNPVTVDGSGDIMARVLGGIVLDPVEMHSELMLVVSISGAITLGVVTVEGDVATNVRNISGGFTLGAVTVAGNVVATDRNVSGDIALGAVVVTGNLATEDSRNISGAILLGAVEVSGELEPARVISGDIAIGAVQVAGGTENVISLTGTLAVGQVTVAGALQLFLTGTGAIVLGPVVVSGVLFQAPLLPGSCLASDAPSGTVEIEDGPAGSALAVDAESGSVTIGDQAI